MNLPVQQKEINRITLRVFKVAADGTFTIDRKHLLVGVILETRLDNTSPWVVNGLSADLTKLQNCELTPQEYILVASFPHYEQLAAIIPPSDFKNKGKVYSIYNLNT